MDRSCALGGCAEPSPISKKKPNTSPQTIQPPRVKLSQQFSPPWTASPIIPPWEESGACRVRGNLQSLALLMSYPTACEAAYWKSFAFFTERGNGHRNLRNKFPRLICWVQRFHPHQRLLPHLISLWLFGFQCSAAASAQHLPSCMSIDTCPREAYVFRAVLA